MRKLMWVGGGFTAACLLGAYLLSQIILLVVGIVALITVFVLFLILRKDCLQKVGAYLLLGLGLGAVWYCLYATVFLAPARNADGKVMQISAEAVDYSYLTAYGSAVEADAELDGRTFRAMLYLEGKGSLSPGDRIEGEFLLTFTGPEGEKQSEYHSGSGVFLLAYQREDVSISAGSDRNLVQAAAVIRRNILDSILASFPEDVSAFAKALLLGDTTDIDYETKTALTQSGIVHVVAVSGLHISILLSMLFAVCGRRKFLTPIAGTILLIFAAAVTGFSPSVVRSCLMNGLMLFALMAERNYDPLTALAFAVLVILGINPLSITSIGLQLSAASVLGINLFAAPIGHWIRSREVWAEAKRRTLLHRLREWVATTASVTLSATIASAPLTALHFGTVSIVGILTNMAVLWVVNYVFIGIVLCALLSCFWAWCSGVLAWILAWGIRYVLLVARILGGFPLAAVYTESPYIVAWLVCVYAMLAVFLLLKKKSRWQLCVMTVVTFLAALAFSYAEPRLDDLRVTVLDVGQGQCVILQSQGRTYMVDCGGSRDETAANKAVATLYSQGIFRLDGLILTHYDRDHVGAAAYLLSRVGTDKLYLPSGPGRERWEQGILDGKYNEAIFVTEDQSIVWDGVKITIFCPAVAETSNESSLCVLFQKENYDILITGDQDVLGEKFLLAENDLPKLDILVVSHHGANSATGEYFLERTRPELALISVGEGNAYGHPSQNVLERLRRYGCIIRRTDLEGTIIIRR